MKYIPSSFHQKQICMRTLCSSELPMRFEQQVHSTEAETLHILLSQQKYWLKYKHFAFALLSHFFISKCHYTCINNILPEQHLCVCTGEVQHTHKLRWSHYSKQTSSVVMSQVDASLRDNAFWVSASPTGRVCLVVEAATRHEDHIEQGWEAWWVDPSLRYCHPVGIRNSLGEMWMCVSPQWGSQS